VEPSGDASVLIPVESKKQPVADNYIDLDSNIINGEDARAISQIQAARAALHRVMAAELARMSQE
jgi:hypothetical protein